MINDTILDKVLDKIKEVIGIDRFDDTKILIDTDGKLQNHITLKIVVMLMTYVIIDSDQFYLQLFLEEALVSQN